ncbi:hypothetical protein NUU61_007401 [Penicillium alfredii]|uniref:Rpr2-domain-containing protein n=1 Tax=Penicillium alfredii TaxID=1506179 RepID=A0A9W9F300_9EURO|nr:uncharacterized protein NUU61_007401 [Penicillium alfredii]KAJ5092531.1 hypothetical protein NUU61_007401 [Penicillium alfredii]
MAKAKGKKDAKHTQSHIRARLEYLQHAATYLHNAHRFQPGNDAEPRDLASAQLVPLSDDKAIEPTPAATQHTAKAPSANLSRAYISQMRGVSLKTQIRLPRALKRSFCKRCDTLLTPGVNCTHEIQNASHGGKKPWADVLVVRCLVCKAEKRFPQTEKRGKKLVDRRKESQPPIQLKKS